ncbi:MAG: hypothetical protein KTR31_26790 [Myxococcales bacterium]|nr:hypothetical protein [Myxococcales bacterium]
MLLLFVQTALAGTLQVPSKAYPSIQDALDDADTGDVIEVAPGTYVEQLIADDNRTLTIEGLGVTVTPPVGAQQILTAESSNLELTVRGITFDGEQTARGMLIQSGALVVVEGCTFRNGSGGAGGGGIQNSDSNSQLVVRDSLFEDNVAERGAHLNFNNGNSLTIERSTFVGGRTDEDGGGVRAANLTVTMEDVVFEDNRAIAVDSTPARGGAVFLSNTRDSTISGALFCNNEASHEGGAIHARNGSTELTVTGSLFLTNTSGTIGGAISTQDGDFDTVNNHFVSNTSVDDGAAIHLTDRVRGTHVNALFAHNASTNGVAYFDGQTREQDVSYPLFFSNVAGDANVKSATVVVGNPLLTNWTNKKGSRSCLPADVVPVAGSPAIDAGDPSLKDLDGTTSDIGAFGGARPFFLDEDADGAQVPFDCDDTDPDVFPGAPELCNGVDDNCDGVIDEDADQGSGEPEKPCDGIDNDCDPATPDATDLDLDTFDSCIDCDDTDPDVFPKAPETVGDGVDQDCDGVDLCFRDEDGDGYGNATVPGVGLDCTGAAESALGGDCNDGDPSRSPGLAEILCNGIDDDCDEETIDCAVTRSGDDSPLLPDGCACRAGGPTDLARAWLLLAPLTLLRRRRQRGVA